MALRDMEHDRPRLEQDEITFFIGRNLPERMQCEMRGFLHRFERKKTHVVRLADFFERPANAHVTRQSLAAIRRSFKSGNGGCHQKAPGDCMTPWCVRSLTERLRELAAFEGESMLGVADLDIRMIGCSLTMAG